MKRLFSLQYAFDHLAALAALAFGLAVLQTFLIGRHYLIPTALLALAVLFGNIAWHGYHDQRWAKHVLWWMGILLTAHLFFALFWSVKYRAILGVAFEPVCAVLTAGMALLAWQYARRNGLARRPGLAHPQEKSR